MAGNINRINESEMIRSPLLEKDRKGEWATRSLPAVEKFFVRHRHRFGYLHLAMFVVFAVLVVAPSFMPLPGDGEGVLENFSRLSNFLIWVLWFPLVLLSVIVFGRIWCGLLCPQGALSEFLGKYGRNRSVPRWMRRAWMPALSFVAVTIMGQLVGVREYPLAALEVLGGTMVAAALVGFLYAKERRAWCRYLCPMGPLLGIFARLGCVGFEKNGGTGKGCPCPTFINTQTKAASSNCIECFRCVNPGSSGTLHLKARRPGLEVEEIDKREPSLWEVLFLFAATGLALGAFHWQVSPYYISYRQWVGSLLLEHGLAWLIGSSGPWWVMVNYPASGEVFNWLDFICITTFMLGAMAGTTLVLSLLTLTSSLLHGKGADVLSGAVRLGYSYAPVALVSLVLGLGIMLFQSLKGLGLSDGAVTSLEAAFFACGALWSMYLAVRIQKTLGPAVLPNFVGIGIVALAWQQVIF